MFKRQNILKVDRHVPYSRIIIIIEVNMVPILYKKKKQQIKRNHHQWQLFKMFERFCS